MMIASANAEEMNYLFRVIDLKQYMYCPRIAYYQIVLPRIRPVTYKMEKGIAAQEQEEGRERRRSLRAYGLNEGTRLFNVAVSSAELLLSGQIDMLIETETELIPVDYKLSKRTGQHYRMQLMAYGRLLEVIYAENTKAVRRGYIYLIPQRKALEVTFDKKLRRQLGKMTGHLREIAQMNCFPEPAKQRRKCVDCEFRRFCNDVI